MSQPLIHSLLASPMSGAAIEARSFEIIDAALSNYSFDAAFGDGEREVVRRMVHTTGDLELASAVRFAPEAIASGVAALRRGCHLIVDANMIRAGLSLSRLRSACYSFDADRIHCYIADPEIAEEANRAGLPRSLFAMRKARPLLDGSIVVFGNSPVALLELNRLIFEEGVRPSLVIGFPVGFVHVIEAKEELQRTGVPFVTLDGRRGGSPLAVAAIHALCGFTSTSLSSPPSPSSGKGNEISERASQVAVALLGHGSRSPEASRDIDEVAAHLQRQGCFQRVEVCHMSLNKPTFAEVIDRCAADQVGTVVVLPYFLHAGVHLKEDIPALLSAKAKEHPSLKLILGGHLGFDQALVNLVKQRVFQAISQSK